MELCSHYSAVHRGLTACAAKVRNNSNELESRLYISGRTKRKTPHKKTTTKIWKNKSDRFVLRGLNKTAPSSADPLRTTPHAVNLAEQCIKRRARMAANGTESSLNSSQHACSLLGTFSWREEYLTPTNVILLIAAATTESVLIPFTVFFNVLVIFLVWRKRYLQKQKPCVLLACLAATDLLMGAVVLPLVVISHIMRLVRAELICLQERIAVQGIQIACAASLLHLAIISGERYVAIKYSLRYETLVTTRRLTTAVATAWAISVVPILIPLIRIIVIDMSPFVEMISLLSHTFVCIPGSVATICYCQVVVFLESRRHRRHILAHQVSEAAAKEILKKDKAARTMVMVVGALLLCYAPTMLCPAVIVAGGLPMDTGAGAMCVSEMLMCANSLVNPIIYCVRTQDFKRAIRELLGGGSPQGHAQDAGNPSKVERRRIGDGAPRPSSGRKQQIALSSRAPTRRSRSHSLDLSRDFINEQRNSRRNSV